MKTKFNWLAATGAAIALAGAGLPALAAQPVNKPVAAAPAAPISFADIVEKVAPAVVSIEVEKKPQRVALQGRGFGGNDIPFELRRFFPDAPQGEASPVRGAGSGFFVSADGYVVTNNHVIDQASEITVRTAEGRSLKARVVGVDALTDLAVLKVDARNLPFVSFEERGRPRVGDWVVAVGNPFGLGGTATAGIVSALGRENVSGSSYVDYMQIDAPINRGNSGGPTFDLNGRVVGVNSAIYSPSGGSVGIGFDIPADVAAQVTQQLISTGKVSRGYIGAHVQDMTSEIAESLNVAAKGALVADVTPGGPAARAGLKSGDIVLRIDGQDVNSAADLTRRVGIARVGGELRLEVRRDGRPVTLTVRPGARPSEEALASGEIRGRDGDGDLSRTAEAGLALQADPRGDGVRVARVAPGSRAAKTGLRTGDVILRAGSREADSEADIDAAIAAARAAGRSQVLLQVQRGDARTFLPLQVGEG